MSGLGLPFDSYKLIAERGIMKSRTLIAIHMSGMGLWPNELQELRKILKVTDVSSSNRSLHDTNIDWRFEIATVKMQEFEKIFMLE